MKAVRKNTIRLVLACCLLGGLFCSEAGAAKSAAWSYHAKRYEIYSPQVSADNLHVVFVRKRHIPDGHEAELFSERELRRFGKQAEANPRFADPEVVLMNLADKNPRFLDYGWGPVFSPDRAKVVYARQENPLSGRRVLAAALAGNGIHEYDLAKRESRVVARPSFGYLSAPRVLANGTTVFALSGAVNGDWGGDVGVGAFDPATGKQAVLYAPSREYNLYCLVEKFEVRDGQCLVFRLRPLTKGTYMADRYAYELVDAASGAVLHRWADRRYDGRASSGFRMCPSGPEVYDGAWRSLDRDKQAPARAADPGRGFSSPDCVHVAVIGEKEVTVRSSSGGPARRWPVPKGRVVQSVSWSPDSSRIVLVVSQGMDFGEKFEFDELVIVPLGDMPPVRQQRSENPEAKRLR